MLDRPTTELLAQILAEERACFDRLCDAVAPADRRALVVKMAELQDQAAEIAREARRSGRSSKPRRRVTSAGGAGVALGLSPAMMNDAWLRLNIAPSC
jgi:hypothetical protein